MARKKKTPKRSNKMKEGTPVAEYEDDDAAKTPVLERLQTAVDHTSGKRKREEDDDEGLAAKRAKVEGTPPVDSSDDDTSMITNASLGKFGLLPRAAKRKATETFGTSTIFEGAVSSMQGWRPTMEDAHVAACPLEGQQHLSFFGVFDGHGGSETARLASTMVLEAVVAEDAFTEGDFKRALQRGFVSADERICGALAEFDTSGCTAVAVLADSEKGKLYVGNAGDSRAVMCVRGKDVPMSFDHKPSNPEERKRIVAAGSFVAMNRVAGLLALSRALGDTMFKGAPDMPREQQAVTPLPDVYEYDLDGVEFIVIACDGIWDVMSNREVVTFVKERVGKKSLSEICEECMDRCLSQHAHPQGLGCDNMTIQVIAVKGACVAAGETAEEEGETTPTEDGDEEEEEGKDGTGGAAGVEETPSNEG